MHAFRAPLLWVMVLTAALFAHPAQAEPNAPADNWGGARSHAIYSAGMGAAAALLDMRPATGFAACLGVGIVKEVGDYYKPSPGTRHGLFSGRDLLADAAGCGLGYLGMRGVQIMLQPRAVAVAMTF